MADPSVPALDLLDAAIAKLDLIIAGQSAAAPKCGAKTQSAVPAAASAEAAAPAPAPAAKAPKQAAAKPSQPAAAATAEGVSAVERFEKALLKIARVASVDEVENSDKLYKLTIDIGGGEIKHVCAGLKQYVARDVLLGSLVTVVLNLKAAKLAGQLSEAMILAADTKAADGSTLVKALVPPAGSEPGDVVYLEGGAPTTAAVKTLKSDDWRAVVAELAVKGSKATLSGKAMVTAKGQITLPAEIPDGAGIH